MGDLSGELGVCHGAAGICAVADAFDRHAGLDDARQLAALLDDYLMARLHDVRTLGLTDRSLLTGASGILSVLLSARGADRAWVRQLGLR